MYDFGLCFPHNLRLHLFVCSPRENFFFFETAFVLRTYYRVPHGKVPSFKTMLESEMMTFSVGPPLILIKNCGTLENLYII